MLFLDRFSKNNQILNLIKILQLGADLSHADKRTDGRTERLVESNSRFSKFCQHA